MDLQFSRLGFIPFSIVRNVVKFYVLTEELIHAIYQLRSWEVEVRISM
jgi:hypothetical protein